MVRKVRIPVVEDSTTISSVDPHGLVQFVAFDSRVKNQKQLLIYPYQYSIRHTLNTVSVTTLFFISKGQSVPTQLLIVNTVVTRSCEPSI